MFLYDNFILSFYKPQELKKFSFQFIFSGRLPGF
ncbi:MAG: hypothetical protein ACI921_001231, partial [Polaribacter sp.]